MRPREVWPYCIAPVVVLLVAAQAQSVQPKWAPLAWIVAGMLIERAFHMWRVTWRAERRLREAEERRVLALLECNCGTINGHPHDPDCVWYDRQKEQRAKEQAGQ